MSDLDVPTSLGTLRARVSGSGPVAVLWHSMFVDSRSWDRVVPALGNHRTLVVVDAPSSGRSDPLPQPGDIAGCADAAAAVVEAVRDRFGADTVDWLGNAWGGHVGLHLAATRSDLIRTLVAISAPTFPIDAATRRKIGFLLPLYRMIGPHGPVRSAIESALFTDATRADDPEAIALLRNSLAHSGRSMITAIETAILDRTDLQWAARQIACPTLLVATDDRGEWTASEARDTAANMLDAQVAEVHAARVIPALEQPVETARLIIDFWSRMG